MQDEGVLLELIRYAMHVSKRVDQATKKVKRGVGILFTYVEENINDTFCFHILLLALLGYLVRWLYFQNIFEYNISCSLKKLLIDLLVFFFSIIGICKVAYLSLFTFVSNNM